MTLKPSDQSHTQHSSAACVMIMMQLQREEVRKRIQKGERCAARKEGETGGIFLHYTVPCFVSIGSIVPHPLQLLFLESVFNIILQLELTIKLACFTV